MAKEIIVAQAQTIADRLNDPNGLWFYYKAVRVLGFQTCYELTSHALDMSRRGKLRETPGAYFNGCVMQEIEKRELRWNTNRHD